MEKTFQMVAFWGGAAYVFVGGCSGTGLGRNRKLPGGTAIMNVDLAAKMEEAWGHIWNRLFCEKTNLFYDYITSYEPGHAFDHLPHPDEIAALFPNPCGWGTGMEDSMLNAGSVMDVLRLRREVIGDPEAPGRAGRVLDGMYLASHVHGVDGFVARSVSPRDGRSCYGNSSRDQFTLCVYGAWRFLRAFPDAPPEKLEKARRLLLDVAAYCERVITVGGGSNLLRLDGRPGLVSEMTGPGVGIHEIMRLPMFYAAAWEASREPHWLELCRRYARPGIEVNLKIADDRPWWDVEFCQMQLSLVLLHETEPEPELREKYREAIRRTAELAEKYFHKAYAEAAAFADDWSTPNRIWRQTPMKIRAETLPNPADSALGCGGTACLMPGLPGPYRELYRHLRSMGNYLYTILLCEEYTPARETLDGFTRIALKPDYNRHASDGPVNLLHGYWVARRRRFFD